MTQPEDQPKIETLRKELSGLFRYIQRVRQEIASIHQPAERDLKFERMTDQLDAIVGATEEATNSIMEAVEKNEEALGALRAELSPEQQAVLDQVSSNNMDIFQACSFQDITGQRISKVLKSVRYVDERVAALVEVWGKDELENVEPSKAPTKTADEELLDGPQLHDEGISQDEIDKLFD